MHPQTSIKKIKSLFLDGKTLREIQGTEGVSRETLKRILLEKGVKDIKQNQRKVISNYRKGDWKDEGYRKKMKETNEIMYKQWRKNPEKHPAWKGGISFEPYDASFNKRFKKAIRKRDNQVCILCGIHREKLAKSLAVHHIDYIKTNTMPQNCVSLCECCHGKTQGNRKHWTKFFQSLLSERYGYEYGENGETIINLQGLGEAKSVLKGGEQWQELS